MTHHFPTARTAAALLAACAATAFADIINVPADQPTIQAGIDAAVNGDEVIVAPGTYNEIIDFSGKDITVRSSAGAVTTIIDATGVPDPGDGLPVVRFDSGETPAAVLEGFTLTGGTGDTGIFGVPVGGGVIVYGADPTVRDCIIENNTTTDGGGGGVLVDLGSVTLDGCTIRFNQAPDGQGGGLFIFPGSDLIMTGCHLDQNSALTVACLYVNGIGSAQNIRITDTVIENHTDQNSTSVSISSSGGSLEIERCVIRNNQSSIFGGGMTISAENIPVRIVDSLFIGNVGQIGGGTIVEGAAGTLIANCAFVGNTASSSGGGLDLRALDTPVVNCSFAGNHAPNGSGMDLSFIGTQTIENCVLWGNTGGAPIRVSGGSLTVNHSIVEGGWGGPGTGNLDVDPLFVDAVGGDLSLMPGSPAIDSGDTPAAAAVLASSNDLGGNSRLADDPGTADTGVPVFGTTIDRGAYEFGSSPAHLIEQQPDSLVVEVGLIGILFVDAPDATAFQWYKDDEPIFDGGMFSGTDTRLLGVSVNDVSAEGLYSVEVTDGTRTETSVHAGLVILPNPCSADFNEDGSVNTSDVLSFLNAWTAGCE